MEQQKITGADLIALGYKQDKAMGIALKTIDTHYRSTAPQEALALMQKVLQYPENCLDDEALGPVARALIEKTAEKEDIQLRQEPDQFAVFGEEYIERGALSQMETAMKLPITVAGALMPDAHQGYGLPIGGVLATDNTVIPYGVGVDIGCRMALSIFDIPEQHFQDNRSRYKRELIAWTKFGAGMGWKDNFRADHAVLDSPEFRNISIARTLKDRAAEQLGTSGGGNHFVEWGIIEFSAHDEELNVPAGRYLALLTHSGSRGLGATIANHYTKLAKGLCRLPQEAANLAYLGLNTAEGQEYWAAMNLAGDYASACHEVIHKRLTKAIGGQVLARVENHHNFAWKETWEGRDVIVHRKGATPAGKGVLGIIPGSMTAPGFLVRGKGKATSIFSASHGAGRQMSRTQAIKNISRDTLRSILKDHGVTLVGGGLDEAPAAYKDINKVMAAQRSLVDVIATFTPQMVRMADDGSRED